MGIKKDKIEKDFNIDGSIRDLNEKQLLQLLIKVIHLKFKYDNIDDSEWEEFIDDVKYNFEYLEDED